MYAVIDCNNFYVSCERVFRPELENRPVVVLSNNDGCIISRSQEVKDLGISIGTPMFEYKDLFKRENVHIFSANFPLYADISSRVMKTIAEYAPRMEVYSIDEVFIDFSSCSQEFIFKQCVLLRKLIQKNVGIPVSIGIGATMTQAKMSNEIAKKNKDFHGVATINTNQQRDNFLKRVEVQGIWGIGRRLKLFLNAHGIYTAYQLVQADDAWVKKYMTISGLHTVWELRGKKCFDLSSDQVPKKSIISSRTFGIPVSNFADLASAVATFTSRAAEKLREEKEVAQYIHVRITTNFHNEAATQALPWATDYTPTLISCAVKLAKSLYRDGFRYKKAAVTLLNLSSKDSLQEHLFHNGISLERETKLMRAVDEINHELGAGTVAFAATGRRPGWAGKAQKRSPRYTTKWDEIPIVK